MLALFLSHLQGIFFVLPKRFGRRKLHQLKSNLSQKVTLLFVTNEDKENRVEEKAICLKALRQSGLSD